MYCIYLLFTQAPVRGMTLGVATFMGSFLAGYVYMLNINYIFILKFVYNNFLTINKKKIIQLKIIDKRNIGLLWHYCPCDIDNHLDLYALIFLPIS